MLGRRKERAVLSAPHSCEIPDCVNLLFQGGEHFAKLCLLSCACQLGLSYSSSRKEALQKKKNP